MVILVAGATHVGKTAYAQRLLEKYGYPYLSIDHLKMGLIRSGQTDLTPMDDDKLTDYLWPIVREMVKTAIENKQNLIVEGCYIPFDWQKDFDELYLEDIRYVCLVFSRQYIENHFADIIKYANIIEQRFESDLSKDELIAENAYNLSQCITHHCNYCLINTSYDELENAGYLYTVAGKGCFVAEKDLDLLREQQLREVEEYLSKAAEAGKRCGLGKDELKNLFSILLEEEA